MTVCCSSQGYWTWRGSNSQVAQLSAQKQTTVYRLSWRSPFQLHNTRQVLWSTSLLPDTLMKKALAHYWLCTAFKALVLHWLQWTTSCPSCFLCIQTIMFALMLFAAVIPLFTQSWKDLTVLLDCWCNIVCLLITERELTSLDRKSTRLNSSHL